MTIIILFLGQIPLPMRNEVEAFHKQGMANAALRLQGDYWDAGHDFDVLDYDINLTVDIPSDTIWAHVTIKLKALSDTLDTLPLNFHWSYKIDSITEGTRKLNWTPVMIDKFKIALGREVAKDEVLFISVFYHGKPYTHKGGLYIEPDDSEISVTYTECEPQGARNWIPCYDEPSDKATFTQRVTVPSGNKVVANGTLESAQTSGAWWTYTWREHYPQATYLVAFAASKHFVKHDTFATIEGEKVPVSTWVLASHDVSTKFKRTPEILEYFSKIFPPYPFRDEKYDHVHMNGWGMENTTCTFLNMFVNWGTPTWEWVIAHEMAHHWWGDWLTCGTWADVWLNEGFGTYCEALWWEYNYGEEGYRAYAQSIMNAYLEYCRRGGRIRPIYDPPWDDLFNPAITYDKGGSVLHMLRQVLGDSIFFSGMTEYALRNANQSVITDDFQNTMEDVSGMDLDWFFDEWIYGPGHPYYEIGWRVTPVTPVTHLSSPNSTPVYQIEFAIAQMQDSKVHYYPFRMPLEVAIYSGNDTTISPFIDSIGYQRFVVEVEGKPDSFRLDPHSKVLCEIKYHEDVDDVPIPGIEERPVNPSASTLLSADALFTDLLHVRFSQPEARHVRLLLYDACGRRLKVLYEGMSKGFYRVYPFRELPKGVYFVRLEEEDGHSISAKTVKIL